MSKDEIRTQRLVLRRARAGDAEAMHAVLSDPAAMRYWSSLPHVSLEETRAWLAGMIDTPPGLGDDFIIEHDGRLIGKAGCWRLPEIGFILHPSCWGQGFAHEAMSAVIPRLFERYPIPELVADVDPRNKRSLALLARLGFEEVRRASRTWLIGDEYCDSVYLALRRPGPAPPAQSKA